MNDTFPDFPEPEPETDWAFKVIDFRSWEAILHPLDHLRMVWTRAQYAAASRAPDPRDLERIDRFAIELFDAYTEALQVIGEAILRHITGPDGSRHQPANKQAYTELCGARADFLRERHKLEKALSRLDRFMIRNYPPAHIAAGS
jgi:hypothetical protein